MSNPLLAHLEGMMPIRTNVPIAPATTTTPTSTSTTAITTPATSFVPIYRVKVRFLPRDTTEKSLRTMMHLSKLSLAGVELCSSEIQDMGFKSAILKFKSTDHADQAILKLNDSPNVDGTANMLAVMLPPSPVRYAAEPGATSPVLSPTMPNPVDLSNPSTLPSSCQSPWQAGPDPSSAYPFNQTAMYNQPNGNMHPNHHQVHDGEFNEHLKNIFAPAVGAMYTPSQPRTSSKSLIERGNADDETRHLLNDPLAFVEETNATGSRRATAPQLPIARMSNLTLNTGSSPISASVPSPYGNSTPTHMNPMMFSNPNGNGNNNSHGNGHIAPSFRPYRFMRRRQDYPAANPADQNPPCNTLYVGNLPMNTSEEELKTVFSRTRGYKRLCFRTKANGPMCFVEFEDISCATKALDDLYGLMLFGSTKGGIRLSFSKNPLGVRNPSTHGPAMTATSVNTMNGMPPSVFNGTTRPPPGLQVPPGLGPNRTAYGVTSPVNGHPNGHQHIYHQPVVGPNANDFMSHGHPAYSVPTSPFNRVPHEMVTGNQGMNRDRAGHFYPQIMR